MSQQPFSQVFEASEHLGIGCRGIFEASMDPALILSGNGTVVECNDLAEELFGCHRQELISRSVDQFLKYPLFNLLGQERLSSSIKNYSVHQDGRTFPVKIKYSAFRIETEPYYIVLLRDATDHQELIKTKKQSIVRERREGLVRRLVEMINRSLDMPDILETAAREVGQFLKVDRALVSRYNYDQNSEKLEIILTSQYCSAQGILPYSDEDVATIYDAFQHLSPELLEEHSVKTTVMQPWEIMEPFYRELLEKFGITDLSLEQIRDLQTKYATQSAMRAGIFYNGKPLGTIDLNQCSYAREWTSDEIEFLQFIADQLGIALAQAEMYQAERIAREEAELAKREAETRLQRENVIRRLVSAINQSLDRKVIMETAAREVGHFFQSDRVILTRYSYDDAAQKLNVLLTTQYCLNESIQEISDEDMDSSLRMYEKTPRHLMNSSFLKTFLMPPVLDEAIMAEFEKQWAGFLSVLNISNGISLDTFLKRYQYYGILSTLRSSINYNSIPYGAIMLQQCSHRREWTADEVEFLDVVAEQLGIALAQAELYQAEQAARQDEVKARNLAETANRKKSEFLGMMSHELRTPLNSIIGYSKMIENEMAGPINEKQAKYIQNVSQSGRHLLDIVNDLLDVSQIETGRLTINPFKFELKPVLDEVYTMMQGLADRKQVSLTFDIQPGLEILTADPGRFKQILINLLNNAIKFNQEQGTVRLRLYTSVEGNQVIGEVVDNGIGIAKDKQKELFTKFYQADARIARNYEGTGLGLALTKELLELHGGKIEVVSDEGIGSIFTFRLPL